MPPFVWLVLLGLIAVNAFYVAAEFAAVAARRGRIRELAQQGHGLAKRLLSVLEDTRALDRYIATCQIGITISSLVLGAFGQGTVAVALETPLRDMGGLERGVAQTIASVVVLVALTATQVVFGELIPKTVALQYPTQVALYTLPPMRVSLRVLAWLITVLNGSGIAILRLLRLPPTSHQHIHSPEEIDLLIAESAGGGVLGPTEQRRLRSALRLGVRSAHELMVPRPYVVAVDVEASPTELLRTVIEGPYTRMPVFDGTIDNVIGMLHSKDLAARYGETGDIPSIRQVMRPMTVVPKHLSADRLLVHLRKARSPQALVVDEHGGTAGLITLEDVLAAVLSGVDDRGAWRRAGQPEPARADDGRIRLPGLLRLEAAERWVGTRWESEADTVGGHVASVLGRMPRPGDRAVIDGAEVEVETVRGTAVWSVLVRPADAEPME